jgi:SAM-dependent methyltransferase
MANTQLKTLEKYIALQQQIGSYHVIMSASRLGILSALEQGQKTDSQIAADCGVEVVPLRLMLAVLVETGLIEKYEELYALAQVARLLPDLKQIDDSQWGGIDLWLKGEGGLGVSDADPLSVQITDPPWMLTPAAMDAAEALDFGGSRTGLRVLEVAGGPCVVSATLAHRDPSSQFVIADLPNGIHLAMETAQSIDRLDQFEFVASNPFDPPIDDNSVDLVLIAGVLRRIPGDQCSNWLTRLARLLKPGGEIAILDWFPGQEKGFRNLVFNQLELSLRHREGGLVTAKLLREWLGVAGLGNVRYANLPAPPHIWGLVLAQKN